MITIGSYNKLTVVTKSPHGLYIGDSNEKILLPNKYITGGMEVGKEIDVFVYTDSLDRPVATTEKPKGVVGDFVFLKAIDLSEYGAFLDWGLDKDLFVPFKHMVQPMVEGKKYVVRICLDELSNRVIGVNKVRPFLKKDPDSLQIGDKTTFMIFQKAETSFSAILNNTHYGRLLLDSATKNLSLGSTGEGFIQRITQDFPLEFSLYPTFSSSKNDLQNLLMDKLRKETFLPYHDKSSSEEIKKGLGMSKKTFKKIIGNLYKSKLISIEHNGIRYL